MRKAKSWFTLLPTPMSPGHEEGASCYLRLQCAARQKFVGMIKDVAAKGYQKEISGDRVWGASATTTTAIGFDPT